LFKKREDSPIVAEFALKRSVEKKSEIDILNGVIIRKIDGSA
jgi:hypothetical protein